MEERDFKDPKWKATRFAAFKRDDFQCVKCGRKEKLQGHHIVRWVDNAKLRYSISNVVTLCTVCHDLVTGREKDFEEEFQRIVQMRMNNIRTDKKISQGKRFNKKYIPRNPYLRY